jgi:hypothetical protein
MAHFIPQEEISAEQEEIQRIERRAVIHLLAGPVIYSVYFMIGYLLAEVGCKTTFLSGSLFGIHAVSVAILLLTAISAGVLLYETMLSFRNWRQYRGNADEQSEIRRPFLWLAGFIQSVYFLGLTVVTGVSVFALDPCVWV